MKKVLFSVVAATAFVASANAANTITLYQDPATGAVYTQPGEGRVVMGDFIDAKSIYVDNQQQTNDILKELKGTKIKSKAKTIEFSGTHYLGLTSNTYGKDNKYGGDTSTGFEMRRSYIQAKAYWNDTDFLRVTLDTTKELESSTTYADVYIKYAYLYLNEILPHTGMEFGIAHRPWIDYEEHNAWYYRSINKVVLEDKFSTFNGTVGPDVLNSADLGVNFKTKTKYISSEIGIFNGEGYHSDKAANNQKMSSDLSFEWRLTGHLLGNGEKVGKYKVNSDEYANISFAGLYSKNHKDNNITVDDPGEFDRTGWWLHAVYNRPLFLVAAQYGENSDERQNDAYKAYNTKQKIWSVNAELRPIEDWSILARYDNLDTEYTDATDKDQNDKNDANQFIYGVAWKQNDNVKWILSGKTVDAKDKNTVLINGVPVQNGDLMDKQTWMLTAEVKW